MTAFFAWLPTIERAETPAVATAMGSALRVHDGQGAAWWQDGPLALGVLELGSDDAVASQYAPVVSADGSRLTWLIGEVYEATRWEGVSASMSRTALFRKRVADAFDDDPDRTLRALDGEFVLLQWDRRAHALTVATDRFGSLPVFLGVHDGAFAVATGVRGVLAASPDAPEPDLDALREAVSYGGFRLGSRTNVRGVELLHAATCLRLTAGDGMDTARWWHWKSMPTVTIRKLDDAVEELHERWQNAVRVRMDGVKRPGQTLSGGLDSRAILAEAARARTGWPALTYGVRGCDDARFAEQAARAARAAWTFLPLYHGGNPDWLAARLAHVQQTDGLIELGDLMHAEALPWVHANTDALVSGYIGDAVVGPTFNRVKTPDDLLGALPYYGDILGEPHEQARERAAHMIAVLDGAPPRFALFDDKLPQSTNFCHGALWRPWVRVRRPFLSHGLFDFAQGIEAVWRGRRDLQGHWLRTRYPALFGTIPNQKTGVPVGATEWQLKVAGARRVMSRTVRSAASALGVRMPPQSRSFTDDATMWRAPGVREAISALLRAPDARHHGAFAPGAVAQVLDAWERDAAAPAQVVGALVVFEHYHRTLAAHLAAARAAGRTPWPRREVPT